MKYQYKIIENNTKEVLDDSANFIVQLAQDRIDNFKGYNSESEALEHGTIDLNTEREEQFKYHVEVYCVPETVEEADKLFSEDEYLEQVIEEVGEEMNESEDYRLDEDYRMNNDPDYADGL